MLTHPVNRPANIWGRNIIIADIIMFENVVPVMLMASADAADASRAAITQFNTMSASVP